MKRFFVLLGLGVLGACVTNATAVTFSKSQSINFYREVASRDLKGLAVRSDGRIIIGPEMRPLAGNPVSDLWWDMASISDEHWLVGSGPDGTVLEVTVDLLNGTFDAKPWAQTDANHVFVIEQLPNGNVVAGAAPDARIYVWDAEGNELAAVSLPADSVLDILIGENGNAMWVATGNPGAVYRIALDMLMKSTNAAAWEDRGIELWGTIRDRNVRCLAWSADGELLAGSSPSGNLYSFPREGGAPLLLMDQESGEITDIHVGENGDIYATLVIATGSSTQRVDRTTSVAPETSDPEKKDDAKPAPTSPSIMEAPPLQKFAGRSSLIVIPGGRGLPETLSSRNNLAMYQILRHGDWLLLPGGDDGELSGYDPDARRAITFAGSTSAQITEFSVLDDETKLLGITNNPAGFSLLDFAAQTPRTASSERINLHTPSEIGALRFNRLRGLEETEVTVRLRANRGRDALEGWTPWVTARHQHGGWTAEGLIGRYLEIELELPADTAAQAELDQAEIFYLPQNRRPVLQTFRLISPNFGLDAHPKTVGNSTNLNLGQIIGTSPSPINKPVSEQQWQALLSSRVVPQPGMQIALWTATDPDEDNLRATFSIRREDESTWTDLVVETDAGWLQFDRRTLPEGLYFTRLTLTEQAPRPLDQRRTVTFKTDDLVIDLTPPEIVGVDTVVDSGHLRLTVSGIDQRSRLSRAWLVFNNGLEVELAQPVDGILDSPAEAFATDVRVDALGPATNVEVYLEDTAGNVATQRLALP